VFKSLVVLCLLSVCGAVWAKQTPLPNDCLEGDQNCTFVLLSEPALTPFIVNESRAKVRMSPYSTFKITNALIALERGLIENIDQSLYFDKVKYPVQAWWPPVWKLPQYNLKVAFKYSMVAVFRQLANDIGREGMASHVKRFDYGNGDISSGLDDFWLNGSLKISALEQVTFLQRIYHNKLGLKSSSLSALKEIMLLETTDNYKLYLKTGAGKLDDQSMLGWAVGFVENLQGVHFFALNLNAQTYAQVKKQRINMVTAHLRQKKVL